MRNYKDRRQRLVPPARNVSSYHLQEDTLCHCHTGTQRRLRNSDVARNDALRNRRGTYAAQDLSRKQDQASDPRQCPGQGHAKRDRGIEQAS